MRLAVAFALAILVLGVVRPAAATPPAVAVQALPADGAAPLEVTFVATGEAASFRWDFGDGAGAEGPTVVHTYGAGRWTATLTAASATGETATQTTVVTAHAVTLRGPSRVRYRRPGTFRGAVVPAERGLAVAIVGAPARRQVRTRADGTFATRLELARPAVLRARTAIAASAPVSVMMVPRLRTTLVGSGARGTRLVLFATVLPRSAGALEVVVERSGTVIVKRTFGPRARVSLRTGRVTIYRIRVRVRPNAGFTSAVHLVRARVVLPRLTYGSRGQAVAQLAMRLRRLHYAAPATPTFDSRLLDAVYAFQKVEGLSRTGVVDAAAWRRLDDPLRPGPRYAGPADHIEIDKGRQVLFVVRGSRVALIVPVSTAGISGYYTPVGRFAIYRKVVGFDPSPLGTLYDPMYFTGGYAIHGNPSVPPYPASHGCVRVPMWIAAYLYETNPYGETVYVY